MYELDCRSELDTGKLVYVLDSERRLSMSLGDELDFQEPSQFRLVAHSSLSVRFLLTLEWVGELATRISVVAGLAQECRWEWGAVQVGGSYKTSSLCHVLQGD